MAIVFVFGVVLALAAPLWRRRGKTAAAVLATGAAILVAFAVLDLVHADPRIGLAAIDSNRRFDLIILGCEVPVLTLAVISLAHWKKAFWAGWIIHLAFTLWLTAVFVWLRFFWHW